MNGLTIKDEKKMNTLIGAFAITGYSIGYGVGIMNSLAVPVLTNYFKLDEDARVGALGNLNSFFPIGAVIGMLSAGKLMATFGRRRLNYYLDGLVILSLLLVVLGSLWSVYLSRFLFGFSSSLYCLVAGITMVECLPTEKSSVGNMSVYVFVTSFLLLVFVQQSIFSEETLVNNWKFFMVYPAVFSGLRLYLLMNYLDFESPVQLASQYASDPNLRAILRENLTKLYEDDAALAHKINELVDKATARTTEQGEASMQQFVTDPQFRKPFLSATLGSIGQQLSGINFLVFFSTQLFDSISGNGKMISVVFGFGNLCGGLCGVYIINKFNRKWLLEKGAIAQGVFLLLIILGVWTGVYFHMAFCVFAYVFTFAIGLGAVLGLYINEIAPPVGAGFSSALNWTTASLVGKLCPLGVYYFGSTAVMAFFCLACFGVSFIVKEYCMESPANCKIDDENPVTEANAVELTDKLLR